MRRRRGATPGTSPVIILAASERCPFTPLINWGQLNTHRASTDHATVGSAHGVLGISHVVVEDVGKAWRVIGDPDVLELAESPIDPS